MDQSTLNSNQVQDQVLELQIHKKVKRNTINEALIAANLGEYVIDENQLQQKQQQYQQQQQLQQQQYMYQQQQNYPLMSQGFNYSNNLINNNQQFTQPPSLYTQPSSSIYNLFNKQTSIVTTANNQDPLSIQPIQKQQLQQNLTGEESGKKRKNRWGPNEVQKQQDKQAIEQSIQYFQTPASLQNNGNAVLQAHQQQQQTLLNPYLNNNPLLNFQQQYKPQFVPQKKAPVYQQNIFSTQTQPAIQQQQQQTLLSAYQLKGVNQPFQQPSQNIETNQIGQSTEQFNSQQQQKSQQNPSELPQSLQDYIQKGFDKCLHKGERKIMDTFLRNIINKARQYGQLYTRDWSTYALPLLPRERNPLINQSVPQNLQQKESTEEKIEQTFEEKKQEILKQIQLEQKKLNAFQATELKSANINNKLTQQQKLAAQKKNQKFLSGLNLNKISEDSSIIPKENDSKINLRAKRFQNHFDSGTKQPTRTLQFVTSSGGDFENDIEELAKKKKIIGTCTNLEKPYLRLQDNVDPATVRPEHILKQSMKMLIEKWKAGTVDYRYIEEQFKSIRQDLLIQGIKNKLTIKVYESNARISLESHDIGQFNQCQTKLNELYKEGLEGSRCEFLSYRIIYLTLKNLKFELNRLIIELSQEDLENPDILVALNIKQSIEIGNYAKIFKIYKYAPNMCQYLLDLFINKLRIQALVLYTKAYIENIDLKYLTDVLAFNDIVHCRDFLISNHGVFTSDKQYLIPKECHPLFCESHLLKEKQYVNVQKQ